MEELGAFADSGINQVANALELGLRIDRANVGVLVEGVADPVHVAVLGLALIGNQVFVEVPDATGYVALVGNIVAYALILTVFGGPIGRQVVEEIGELGRCSSLLTADFGDTDSLREFVSAAWNELGGCDVWVNNAGVDLLTGANAELDYEQKQQKFESTPTEERDANKRPNKYRFPKGFHRGVELFGQERQRLEESGYREAIHRHGLIIVEGFNDVIGLDALQVPAMGICSNHVSEEQLSKIIRLANELAGGKVRLMLDCDAEGEEGAKDAAWKLLQAGLNVRPLWSHSMHGGKFADRQPESLKSDEWSSIVAVATTAPDDS